MLLSSGGFSVGSMFLPQWLLARCSLCLPSVAQTWSPLVLGISVIAFLSGAEASFGHFPWSVSFPVRGLTCFSDSSWCSEHWTVYVLSCVNSLSFRYFEAGSYCVPQAGREPPVLTQSPGAGIIGMGHQA